MMQLRLDEPELNVVLRGDRRTKYRQIARVMELLLQANVLSVEMATDAAGRSFP